MRVGGSEAAGHAPHLGAAGARGWHAERARPRPGALKKTEKICLHIPDGRSTISQARVKISLFV